MRVGRRDLPVEKRIVHDRREEIDRLHKRAVAIDSENAGIIGSGRTDEHISISKLRQIDAALHAGRPAEVSQLSRRRKRAKSV